MFTKDDTDPMDNSSDPNEEFDVDIFDLPSRKSDRIEQQSQHQDARQDEDTLSDASDNNLPPAKKQYTGTANFQPPRTTTRVKDNTKPSECNYDGCNVQ